MHFTTTALSLAALSGAMAQTTVHVVNVGSSDGALKFSPDNLSARVGDMVQFQFWPANHSVVQSTFDNPCTPINQIQSNVPGFFSGFQAVKASDTQAPIYTMEVKAATPMWLYCSQGKHCQAGMVMVINESNGPNSTRTLANYAIGAKAAAANLSPSTGASGGSLSTGTPSNGTTAGSPGSSSSPSAGPGAQSANVAGVSFVAASAAQVAGLLALAAAYVL